MKSSISLASQSELINLHARFHMTIEKQINI